MYRVLLFCVPLFHTENEKRNRIPYLLKILSSPNYGGSRTHSSVAVILVMFWTMQIFVRNMTQGKKILSVIVPIMSGIVPRLSVIVPALSVIVPTLSG